MMTYRNISTEITNNNAKTTILLIPYLQFIHTKDSIASDDIYSKFMHDKVALLSQQQYDKL